jgi:putative intracellular protease/amidase
VPGGAGTHALLNDAETLDFIHAQAKGARHVTSVCTGAPVSGAAKLLTGKRAATHGMNCEMRVAFGATRDGDAARLRVSRGLSVARAHQRCENRTRQSSRVG